MTNAEIINEVNGLLQRALGLLASVENVLPAEQVHAVAEAPCKEVHAEAAHADEAEHEPAPAAQANGVEATVQAAQADTTVVVDQT